MTQDAVNQVEQIIEAAAATGGKSISFWDLYLKGGSLMWVLLVLSFIAVWIFVERWRAIRKASKIDENFMEQIKQYVYTGQMNYATDLCKMTQSPVARLIGKGLERVGRPMSDVQAAVENEGNLEVAKLERGLPMLGTIAGGAPMIGFLGTVVGMVQAFYKMSEAGGNIDISNLSGGIYVAMITTVGGLVVGIMAYFGYNYLVSKIETVVFKMEASTIQFMDLLNEPAN